MKIVDFKPDAFDLAAAKDLTLAQAIEIDDWHEKIKRFVADIVSADSDEYNKMIELLKSGKHDG